ncbi:uncharacterized protein LOC133080425 [Eubalaena glacialis]|uniref:uncharacterized protein LOC133080425 n=1 Tax=Eubalaena glacialis TaxID=27606 RepID=UPI002A59BF27|nr:uncharacterized protein LOC133080425 [Eubalaena glacialis]
MSKGWEEGPSPPKGPALPPGPRAAWPTGPRQDRALGPQSHRADPSPGVSSKAQEEQAWAGLGGPEDSQAQRKRGRLALPGGRASDCKFTSVSCSACGLCPQISFPGLQPRGAGTESQSRAANQPRASPRSRVRTAGSASPSPRPTAVRGSRADPPLDMISSSALGDRATDPGTSGTSPFSATTCITWAAGIRWVVLSLHLCLCVRCCPEARLGGTVHRGCLWSAGTPLGPRLPSRDLSGRPGISWRGAGPTREHSRSARGSHIHVNTQLGSFTGHLCLLAIANRGAGPRSQEEAASTS